MTERQERKPGKRVGGASRPKRARVKKASRIGFWGWLVETYATADPRSLGVFRILFSLVLIHDVVRRWPDLTDHYSNSGWLTNHFAMFRPMSDHLFSLYLAFSTPSEVKVLAAFHILVNVLLLVGWRTRIMQVLAFVLIVSLNSRNIMLENGGFVVVHLLALWSMFLPLGRRYSVDALLRSLKQRRDGTLGALNDERQAEERVRPVRSLAITALILQFALIYYLNVVHKTGASWKDGTAVYYFFQQDRMVTALGAWLRFHMGLGVIKAMTWTTLLAESLIAAFLVSPLYTKWARMVGWCLVIGLHASIDSVVQLGPFSYAMIVVHAVFIPTEAWHYFERRLRKRYGVRVLVVDPGSGFSLWCARLVKRLVPSGSVSFVESSEVVSTSSSGLDANQQLVVLAPGGGQRTGVDALLELVRPSPPLRFALAWLRLPVLRPLAGRSIDRWVGERAQLSQRFGLENFVGVDADAASTSRERWLGRVGNRLADVVLLFFMVSCGSQVLMENRAIPQVLKLKHRPEWMTAAVVYPRLFQGWSMFAPEPPKDDGKIVVDGLTKDGRHFDPLTESEPNFELNPPEGFQMNQLWGDFHRRIWQARFRGYWNGFRDYLKNHHELTGKPEDELVAFDVYYVSELVPPPGAPRPAPRKERLFSFGNMRRPSPKGTSQRR